MSDKFQDNLQELDVFEITEGGWNGTRELIIL